MDIIEAILTYVDGEENIKTQTTKNKGIKFENDSGVNEYVGVGFNKSAFFFNSLWLIEQKYYGRGIIYFLFQFATLILYIYFMPEEQYSYRGLINRDEIFMHNSFGVFLLLINLPIQLYLGFNGNKIHEKRLKWYGFKKVEDELAVKKEKED